MSVGRSVGRSARNAFVSTGRDEPANDLFRVYELVTSVLRLSAAFHLFYVKKSELLYGKGRVRILQNSDLLVQF